MKLPATVGSGNCRNTRAVSYETARFSGNGRQDLIGPQLRYSATKLEEEYEIERSFIRYRPPRAALDIGDASSFVRSVLCGRRAGANHASAPDGALPSWNDGPAKLAILDFVRATTDQGSPKFVPSEDRVATFDQDGTLWVEHPIYSQFIYCLDRVPAVVKAKPALAKAEPFKTVLSGDREAIAKLPLRGLEEIAIATLSGMTVDVFQSEVKKWLESAKDPRWKRPYTDLTYQPMQDVLSYLRANGYKTYIVTGGGQDFVRMYSERVYGIPREQVVGSAGETTFGYDKVGSRFWLRSPKSYLTIITRAKRRTFIS